MGVTAERSGANPLIWPHMDGRMGDNINGPSVIRMPDWASGLGRYHMYFSDHKGKYIRLAYTDQLSGSWTMHEPGVLDLEDSHFPYGTLPEPPPDHRPAWAKKMAGGYLYTHIASPDMHVDEAAGVIRMYYHGLLENGDQKTRLAVSHDGLHFDAQEPLLGTAYFRCFAHGDHVYALGWGGLLYRAADWDGPFEQGHMLIPFEVLEGIGRGFRHGAVLVQGDTLHILYTRMGDTPEAILYATVDLASRWTQWRLGEAQVVLSPELDWEGADLPIETSRMGAVDRRVHALRDPCFFEDDGALWMFYCGAGESAIGLARLHGL